LSRIVWDATGDRFYERGVDRGVLYVENFDGVPWNGLISVDEKPSGGDIQSYYMDGQKYFQETSSEDYSATITAFTYPDEFEFCEGIIPYTTGMFLTAQSRKSFGFTYRTLIGNDVTSEDGYKIHIIYGAMATPTDRNNVSVSDQINATSFSWDIQAVPVIIPKFKGTAHIVIDSRTIKSLALSEIEDILYGNDSNAPRIPDISEVGAMIDSFADLMVIDNGDGTFTISGDGVTEIDANTYTIDWPSVVEIDSNTYQVTSQ
jgi:hypothetical protein